MQGSWLLAALGGALIGSSAALLMVGQGRIAGISGIVGGLLQPVPDRDWRIAFLFGLIAAGIVGTVVAPHAIGASVRGLPLIVIAGVLVGVGTRMGSGCTSGHGVCGLARLSRRSLVAVGTFMATGAITAILMGGR